MNEKAYSPFYPGNPLPAEYFVGRTTIITNVVKCVEQAKSGRHQNVFLTGDRGIGKSSLASFLKYLAVSKHEFIGVHVFLGGVTTLEELIRRIFDDLLKQTQGNKWFDKISKFFGDNIQELGLFGVNVAFTPPQKDLRQLVRRFPEAILNLIDKIRDEKKGIFIALDDINGLADKAEFADWYKSFVDEVATKYPDFPVVTMIIGLPEKRERLAALQPSLMRIFRVEDMDRLTDSEVSQFAQSAFERAGLKCTDDALKTISFFSSGLPIILQEIGDATFWLNDDDVVSEGDAREGILFAAEQVGKKYLTPKVYSAIRSDSYRSILRKLGQALVDPHFKRKEVIRHFSAKETKVFDNFLRRMRELGVIESDPEGGTGSYRFVNMIYLVSVYLESQRAKQHRD